MEAIKKITLTEEKETLLITLYAKAMDYRSNRSILHDRKADDLIKMISAIMLSLSARSNLING